MTGIREIFKTIQKYFGLFMNSGDENSNYSRYSECNEKSQSLCNGRGYFANAQYDEIKPVIVSESETIQSIVNQNQLQENKYAPTSKSKISVLPQGVDMTNSLAPCGRADLRTDGVKRVRIANRLSTLLRSNMYETLRAWSEFKTGQGEGFKAAFTEPSRGMSGAKVEQTSAETLSFRCVCERCRLMRGDVRKTIRKAAFTLAEVLITLGIIGVVAALTLPTLIQNHQKQVYVTQLKKAYSTINNAFNKMAADEGVVDWNQTYCGYNYQTSDANPFDECIERITKQMKVVGKAGFGSYRPDCPDAWCSDWYDPKFVTSDGMVFLFPCCNLDILVVDVNGAKKNPNKLGRDLFAFYIDYSKNKIIPYGTEADMVYVNNEVGSWEDCNVDAAWPQGLACTAKVLIEGKMNY